jgi:hypothetical protein
MELVNQKTDWRGRFFRYAPLVLWIGLILFLSSGQASMSNTSRFIRPLLVFLFPNRAGRNLEYISRLHSQIGARHRVCDSGFLGFAGFFEFAAKSFAPLLVRFGVYFGLSGRFG